jgi:hypothetical protein
LAISSELQAQIVALSMQKEMGMNVDQQINSIINGCSNEEDKKVVMGLCRTLGLK